MHLDGDIGRIRAFRYGYETLPERRIPPDILLEEMPLPNDLPGDGAYVRRVDSVPCTSVREG